MLGQAVVDVQLRDLHLEPLPVRRVLDPDGSQVFWGHPGDGGHVVARRSEEVKVLLIVEIRQPSSENFFVRNSRVEHLLDVERLDVVRVQAWLDRSPACEGVNQVGQPIIALVYLLMRSRGPSLLKWLNSGNLCSRRPEIRWSVDLIGRHSLWQGTGDWCIWSPRVTCEVLSVDTELDTESWPGDSLPVGDCKESMKTLLTYSNQVHLATVGLGIFGVC